MLSVYLDWSHRFTKAVRQQSTSALYKYHVVAFVPFIGGETESFQVRWYKKYFRHYDLFLLWKLLLIFRKTDKISNNFCSRMHIVRMETHQSTGLLPYNESALTNFVASPVKHAGMHCESVFPYFHFYGLNRTDTTPCMQFNVMRRTLGIQKHTKNYANRQFIKSICPILFQKSPRLSGEQPGAKTKQYSQRSSAP